MRLEDMSFTDYLMAEYDLRERQGKERMKQEEFEKYAKEHNILYCAKELQEPCDDVVSRQAVLDITWEEPSYTDALNVLTEVRDKVKSLPSVNPQEPCSNCCNGNQIEKAKLCQKSYLAGMEHKQEPKTGKWEFVCQHWRKCSECGFSHKFAEDWNYCPNCGAKMVEQRETETWHGIHAQITAPNGTFERIFNEADDDYDI